MAKDYLDLAYDEIVIIKDESVAHGGVAASFTDELILTNQRIICVHKGVFGKVKQVFSYPLYQIKTYDGKPQVMMSRTSNGSRCLDIYLHDGVEHFQFSMGTKKRIEQWIDEVYKLLLGEAAEKPTEDESEYDPYSLLGQFAEMGQQFKDMIGIRSKPKEKDISQQKEHWN